MKKFIYLLILAIMPLSLLAQSYASLWKKVAEAKEKDLPKTQIERLGQIIKKAEKEKQYGHLLKAQLQQTAVRTQIAPKTVPDEIERLEEKTRNEKDDVLRAIYATVLGKISEDRYRAEDDAKSRLWYAKAMENPALLAAHKSEEYEPFMVNGADSKIFYGDLLHVIGFEAKDYTTLHRYYSTSGNRAAACLTGCYMLQQSKAKDLRELRKSKHIQKIDSLINVYGDLREAGELAIERYECMALCADATVEERYNYINYALSRWGTWPRMNILRNAQGELQRPKFDISIGDYMLLPNAERKVYINSIRNIDELYVNLYRLNIDGDTKLEPSDSEDYEKLRKHIVPGTVQSITRRYIGQPVWKVNYDSLFLDKLPVGVYLVEASTDNKSIEPERALLRVSDLYVMHEQQPDNRIRFVVLNATTGKPVAGAQLNVTTYATGSKEKDATVTLTGDRNGEVFYRYAHRTPDEVYVYTKEDRACGNFRLDGYYSHWEKKPVENKVSVYTDRAIYRPGQQVHVAAIACHTDNNSMTGSAIGNHELTFTLRDANGKEVATKKATTDGFGTAAADFMLPQQGLTGNFRIDVKGKEVSSGTAFKVEQYKKPTFQVEFDDYKQAYQPGDTVLMRGVAKSYAGIPVQGAKVAYTVKRQKSLWWQWYDRTDSPTLLTDSATTADDGSFVVRMPMMFPDNADIDRPLYYKVAVEAKVTDTAGETHEASASLPLSNRASVLTANIAGKSLRDSLKTFSFTLRNVAGQEIVGKVKFRFDDGTWETAEANNPISIGRKFASGSHRLVGICDNDTVEQKFVVFSYADKKPATDTPDWFYISDNRFRNDGKPVYIQLGSSDEDVHVYYSVFKDKKILAQGSRVLNNEVQTEKLVYKEEYGDGILINLAWVKRGRLYTHRIRLQRPEPDNRLTLSWKTFRNQLTPGQKEEWTLQILGPDGKPSRSQLLATLYDKSLDDISKHHWAFSHHYSLALPYTEWDGGSNEAIGLYGYLLRKDLNVKALEFTHISPEAEDFSNAWLPYSRVRYSMTGSVVTERTRAVRSKAMSLQAEQADMRMTGARKTYAVSDNAMAEEHGSVPQKSPAQVRENFNETAFFYPTLTTDARGNVNIRFTLPESVTTWHFMGIAHDEQINFGTITADAVARKSVMVQPHLPRFIRVGDKAQISSRITNTSSKMARGTVRLQLLNPATEDVVCEWTKPFAIEDGKTTSIGFDVDGSQLAALSKDNSLFIVRITAEGKDFSDGEQHYLPLLPNREYITTSVAFTQNGAGTKTIDLGRLFPTADAQNRLTVEYTNNPAWLMIQTLPSIANPHDKNAISLAAAIYANSIGYSIIKSSPKIAQTLKLWQMETGKETSLMSSLQKNEDLKTMVLSETPWVAAAEREADQKQQLLNFLDESAIGYRLQEFTDKLQALQHEDGSFSWWPGMPGSAYMTMAVTKILTRLNSMTGPVNATSDMLKRAFAYLDGRIAEEVSELKKLEKKGQKQLAPGEMACDYLYTSALANRPESKDAAYLVGLLEKMPASLTIYGKANAAVILIYYDKKQRAREFLQSMNEYSVYTEEMGRYYETRRASYSWCDYKIPTQVAAIEAMQILEPADSKTIEEMQRWLLQEKRTTSWDTPLNTVNAVYAYMTNEQSKIDMSKPDLGRQTALKIDGKGIELPQATAGLGYVKASLSPAQATTFTAEKTSDGTAWGAVYAQHWQKTTDVESASAGLSVHREIIASDGSKGADKLKVGDKIKVRIVITADRDYDFVQIQDKRAACLEPAVQLSGYRRGYYCAPQDNVTNYYFDQLAQGTHVVETEYYVDREGDYTTGICTAQCAYSPEFSAREGARKLHVGR